MALGGDGPIIIAAVCQISSADIAINASLPGRGAAAVVARSDLASITSPK
jgi:hypothetical protein